MAKHYLFARLGGADAMMLADEETAGRTGERTRFVAMAGVLITTACVASLSMFFALHHAISVTTGWSILLALAWGVVIINIDRFLIITLSGARRRPVRLAVTVFIRVLLAAIIAIVVATPLVLQIFASDIRAEIPDIQQQQSAAFVKSLAHNADEQQLAKDNAQIKIDQSAADGSGEEQVSTDQAIVNKLTGEVLAASTAVSTAYTKYECEIGGYKGSECPPGTTGLVGNGPLATADKAAWEATVANYDSLNSQLTTAKNNLAAATAVEKKTESAASQEVTRLTNERNTLQATINAQISADNRANDQDNGLLEQVHALFAASAADPALAWTHWIVTALFFIIEILPVTVKSLLLLGEETPYEKIVKKRGEAAVEQAERMIKAEEKATDIRALAMLEIAQLVADAERDARKAALDSDLAIARDKEQARLNIEADLTRREKGTRIEANKRFSSASRDHILAAIDDWAFKIREAIRLGAQQPSANGKVPSSTGQGMPGSNGTSGGI